MPFIRDNRRKTPGRHHESTSPLLRWQNDCQRTDVPEFGLLSRTLIVQVKTAMHGGGGRGMMRGSSLQPSDQRPIQRATVRRVLAFFHPYRFRVALTLFA